MVFTNEELAMIEGAIGAFFSNNHASKAVRCAYTRVIQHLADDTLDAEDYQRISNAADFAIKNRFCESCSREDQHILTTILIKATSAPIT